MGDACFRVNPLPHRLPQKQKAPSRDGALSQSFTASLHLFFVFAVVPHMLAPLFGPLVIARQNAGAAVLESAFVDARHTGRRMAELDSKTAEFGFGRRAGEQRRAHQQARYNEDFAHGTNHPCWRKRASTPLELQNIKQCAAWQAPHGEF
jgi:hypothetical protein